MITSLEWKKVGFQKGVLNGKFHNAKEGRITNPRNTTLKELGIEKMEAPLEGGKGPEGVVAPYVNG